MKATELNQLKPLLYFDIPVLERLFPGESNQQIRNRLTWLNKKQIIHRLKQQFYLLNSEYEAHKRDEEYFYCLGSALKSPAYISRDTVLRRFDVLTEGTYGYQLMTTKSRATFNNNLATFNYVQISDALFTGYTEESYLDFKYLIASKAKALFDWLYVKLHSLPPVNDVDNWVEELRLNLESFTPADFNEMKRYADVSRYSVALTGIINNLETHAPHH